MDVVPLREITPLFRMKLRGLPALVARRDGMVGYIDWSQRSYPMSLAFDIRFPNQPHEVYSPEPTLSSRALDWLRLSSKADIDRNQKVFEGHEAGQANENHLTSYYGFYASNKE